MLIPGREDPLNIRYWLVQHFRADRITTSFIRPLHLGHGYSAPITLKSLHKMQVARFNSQL